MMTPEEPAEQGLDLREIAVEARWIGIDEQPAVLVNQMLGQVHEGEIVLTFGFVTPPPILGADLAEKERQAREIGVLPIRPVARIALTPGKLREVARAIDETIANYDRQEKVRAEQKPEPLP